MNENESAVLELRRKSEKDRLAGLPDSGKHPLEERGVLLSDKIERYCQDDCKLISPYHKDNLRPAGYDLSVGENYVIAGVKYPLSLGNKLPIKPYTVAVIETRETVNLPPFLIGRWNIVVKLAYKGLLWVGGAQVDPGFRGKLNCPIYNLSDELVMLEYGQDLAMIDFVTTTQPIRGVSKPYLWRQRSKVLIEDYAGTLTSGVEARLDEIGNHLKTELERVDDTIGNAAKETNRRANKVDARIDTFVSLVFTVVAVLFAGLGIVATKSDGRISIALTPVLVAAIAFYLALRAFERAVGAAGQDSLTKPVTVARIVQRDERQILVCIVAVALLLAFSGYEWVTGIYHVKEAEAEYRAKAREYELRSRDLDAYKRELSGKVESLETTLKSYQSSHPQPAPVKERQ